MQKKRIRELFEEWQEFRKIEFSLKEKDYSLDRQIRTPEQLDAYATEYEDILNFLQKKAPVNLDTPSYNPTDYIGMRNPVLARLSETNYKVDSVLYGIYSYGVIVPIALMLIPLWLIKPALPVSLVIMALTVAMGVFLAHHIKKFCKKEMAVFREKWFLAIDLSPLAGQATEWARNRYDIEFASLACGVKKQKIWSKNPNLYWKEVKPGVFIIADRKTGKEAPLRAGAKPY